jgi:hypothetical protein
MKSIGNLCLKTGDWFLMKYGFDFHKFYIAEICGNMVRLSKNNWLASSGRWLTREDIERTVLNISVTGNQVVLAMAAMARSHHSIPCSKAAN